MGLLIVGLILFVGVHLVPAVPSVRDALVTKVGENGYKGAFSVVSLVGLALAVIGYSPGMGDPVWTAAQWAKPLAVYTMPFVFILFIATYTRSHIRRLTRHPMSIAVALWAVLHLLVNGDAPSVVLFGALGAYSVVSAISAQRRGKVWHGQTAQLKFDIVCVVVGIATYALVLYGHEYMFGAPLV